MRRQAAHGAGLLASFLAFTGAALSQPADLPANSALARWIASVGGRPALASVSSMEISETSEEAQGSPSLAARTVILGPSMLRIEIALAGSSTLVVATDGTTSWREVDGLGFDLLKPEDMTAFVMCRDPVFVAKFAGQYLSSDVLPQELHDGVTYDTYLVHLKNQPDERWSFAASTGFLARIEGVAPYPFVMEFSDYRAVGPLRLPFEFRFKVGSSRISAVHRKAITLNVPLTPSYFTALPWDVAEAKKCDAILDKYASVCASPQTTAKWRSRIVHVTTATPAIGVESKRSITLAFPNKILVDTETKGLGHTLMGYDGKAGWAYSEIQGSYALKPSEIPVLYSSLFILGYPTLGREAPLRRMLGPRVIGGRAATALQLSTLREPLGTFYFDDENGWLLRFGSQRKSAGGSKPVETIDFSDYRTVNGHALPYQVIETTISMQVITRLVSVEDDVPVDDTIFKERTDD